jgi:plastocyanin
MSKRSVFVLVVLSLAALALPGDAVAGGFCSGFDGETFSDASGTRVRMAKNCFSPTVLRVEAGDTVTWVNADPEIHGVGGAAGSFGDPHGEIKSGDSVSFRFDDEGVYPYACIFHPGMTGAVVVGDGVGTRGGGAVVPASEGRARSEPTSSTAADESSGVVMGLALAVAVVLLLAAVAALIRTSRRQPRTVT